MIQFHEHILEMGGSTTTWIKWAPAYVWKLETNLFRCAEDASTLEIIIWVFMSPACQGWRSDNMCRKSYVCNVWIEDWNMQEILGKGLTKVDALKMLAIMLWNNLIINLGRSVLKLVTTCLLTTQLRILSIFSSNLINYNHDVYKGIAWISRKICRSGLVDEEMEPTHEDDRDILLLGWVGWDPGPPICPNNPEPPIIMVHWKMEVSPIDSKQSYIFHWTLIFLEKEYVQPRWKTEQQSNFA